MTPHNPREFSTKLIDGSPFVILGNTMPPRDPDEDEENGDEEKRKRKTNTKWTAPTNRRSCASRTKIRA